MLILLSISLFIGFMTVEDVLCVLMSHINIEEDVICVPVGGTCSALESYNTYVQIEVLRPSYSLAQHC